jgi:hypothetical protein
MMLNMTYAALLKPELPCSLFFGEDGGKMLYCMANKTEKEPYTKKEAADYTWEGRNGRPAMGLPV